MSRTKVYSKFGITLRIGCARRPDMNQWFSISPMIHELVPNDRSKDKVLGFGIYGPRRGILIDWWRIYRKYKPVTEG